MGNTNDSIFEELCECLELAWRGDDQMDQSDLFELQGKLAVVCLDFASKEQAAELVKKFPYVYHKKEEDKKK